MILGALQPSSAAALAVLLLAPALVAAEPGPPPDVVPVGGDFDAEAEPVSEPPPPPPPRSTPGATAGAGAHHFWISGKTMPGVTLRAGTRWVGGEFEGSFIWLTEPAETRDLTFVGNHFGLFVMATPLLHDRFRVAGGIGGDFFPLWNIHEDEWLYALVARVRGDVRITSQLWGFATARSYLIHSDGLELGVTRDGDDGLPVLFGTGLEWSFQ